VGLGPRALASLTVERLDATVSGRVQGVGYRWFVVREASRLGLAGTVRNEADGRVTVAAEGERAALEALLAALHRGPPAARVEDVGVAWGPASGASEGFDVER
jgi:acylphosphatase